MPSNIQLSSASRAGLLSLQNTTNLIAATQGRLSTGLKVASAVDNAISFFQAQALDKRASDLNEKKYSIDQGISTLKAAANGVGITVSASSTPSRSRTSKSRACATAAESSAVPPSVPSGCPIAARIARCPCSSPRRVTTRRPSNR